MFKLTLTDDCSFIVERFNKDTEKYEKLNPNFELPMIPPKSQVIDENCILTISAKDKSISSQKRKTFLTGNE